MSYMKYRDAEIYHTSISARFKDVVDIGISLLHETPGAYLFDTGDTDKKGKPLGVWIPKSMCEYRDEVLYISEKFAIEKGLL